MSSMCKPCLEQDHLNCEDIKILLDPDPAPCAYGSCFCQCQPLKAEGLGKHQPRPEITMGADE